MVVLQRYSPVVRSDDGIGIVDSKGANVRHGLDLLGTVKLVSNRQLPRACIRRAYHSLT